MADEETVVAFSDAVSRGAVAEVGALLDEDGRLLEARDPNGFMPLIVCAIFGHADLVRLLLGRGADIEATDSGNGWTALYYAVGATKEVMISILVGHGANASMVGPSGCTPLIFASRCGSSNIVKRLLRSLGGQGLDAQAMDGGTAFAMACREGHVEVARMLLLEGADHTIAAHDGTTARMKAEVKGHAECVALIQVRNLKMRLDGLGMAILKYTLFNIDVLIAASAMWRGLAQWWEGELERAYVVHRARYHVQQYDLWQPCLAAVGACIAKMPPVPTHLGPRFTLPQLDIVSSAQEQTEHKTTGQMKEAEQGGEGPCEGEKQATLQYVMHDLAPELYIELMAGFH